MLLIAEWPLASFGPGRPAAPRARGFEVVTTDGEVFTTPLVIAATGGFSRPHRPDLPGLDGFTGTVLHSSGYRCPEPFAGSGVSVR